jgi:NAD+ kinase
LAPCDLALVVSGDNTIGIGRQLAQFGIPLVSINNQVSSAPRLSPLRDFQTTLGHAARRLKTTAG